MCENSVFKLPLITLFIHSKYEPNLERREKIMKRSEEKEKKRFVRINKMNHHFVPFSAAVGLSIGLRVHS